MSLSALARLWPGSGGGRAPDPPDPAPQQHLLNVKIRARTQCLGLHLSGPRAGQGGVARLSASPSAPARAEPRVGDKGVNAAADGLRVVLEVMGR